MLIKTNDYLAMEKNVLKRIKEGSTNYDLLITTIGPDEIPISELGRIIIGLVRKKRITDIKFTGEKFIPKFDLNSIPPKGKHGRERKPGIIQPSKKELLPWEKSMMDIKQSIVEFVENISPEMIRDAQQSASERGKEEYHVSLHDGMVVMIVHENRIKQPPNITG